MDHDERTTGAWIMARIDAYRSVFQHASLIADGVEPNELLARVPEQVGKNASRDLKQEN